MGSYNNDSEFFKSQGIETIDLNDGGQAHVMVIPAYQGRVMTSSASGVDGDSFGWINYDWIRAGEISPAFNPFGGEERFWIGPEGGAFSWFFKKGQKQEYSNWIVPSILDTDVFEVVEKSSSSVTLKASTCLTNASDNAFNIGFKRKVSLLDAAELQDLLGVEIPDGLQRVAYSSANTLTNEGADAWGKEYGMPCVWMLGMFNPTETTTVFIPYRKDAKGTIVNDGYFGKVPSDRLLVDDGTVFFKIDGKYRAKIGLPAGSARDVCGSYDSAKQVLTILKYSVPAGNAPYLNGQWGDQENPFDGDVINSYNDGPTETGHVMGPFYEIETSSPGAALAPGESLTHTQYVIHIQGGVEELDRIAEAVFGIGVRNLCTVFTKY